MRLRKKILIGILVLFVFLFGFALYYINDYYHPTVHASKIAETMKTKGGNYYFEGTTDIGFIIYPGGKVDERAYAPLAEKLHENNDTVVILSVLFRLAILDTNKAESVIRDNPQIKHWYIIGHSLGGTAASMFAADHHNKIDGLVFLGSYTNADLSKLDIHILTITGSNDKVRNHKKAKEALPKYPKDIKDFIIQGGNHAFFGSYGKQSGDGSATITDTQQQEETKNIIFQWIQNIGAGK